jgi:hypothetical protein
MADNRGSNALVDYLRALLDDHATWEKSVWAGPTGKDYFRDIEALLPDAHKHEDFSPRLEKLLAINAGRPADEQLPAEEVEAQVRRLFAHRAWEDANYEPEQAIIQQEPLALFTPWAFAVSCLVRWIDVPGVNEDQLRTHLASLNFCGPTERDALVAELERLDKEGYASTLAEIVKREFPVGAARIAEHPKGLGDDEFDINGKQSAKAHPADTVAVDPPAIEKGMTYSRKEIMKELDCKSTAFTTYRRQAGLVAGRRGRRRFSASEHTRILREAENSSDSTISANAKRALATN